MLGGRWNSKEKVWKIAYGKVKILNLEERIVEKTEKKQVKKIFLLLETFNIYIKAG